VGGGGYDCNVLSDETGGWEGDRGGGEGGESRGRGNGWKVGIESGLRVLETGTTSRSMKHGLGSGLDGGDRGRRGE
jgi:hypothetical protein